MAFGAASFSTGGAGRADVVLRAPIGQFRADITEARQLYQRSTAQMSDAALRMQVAQDKLDRAIHKFGAESRQAKQATLDYRREMRALEQQADRTGRELEQNRRTIDRTMRTAAASGGLFRGFGRNVAFASGSLLGGTGLVYALKSTLHVAGEFQQQLNILGAVSNATSAQLSEASRIARELGNDLTLPKTSAKDAAVAMTELAKAGLTVDQAIAAAKGTLQLAAAAGIEAGEAAKISGSALNAFALDGGNAIKVADALAGAANAAQGEIPDMALALQQASAVAHQSGLTMGETVTAITELARAGIQGSDAGTSLRVMLTRLGAPTQKAAEEMDRLGVSTFDAQGNFKPFRQIVDEYAKALSKLTPAQRAQALNTIFGTDAQRAANIILRQGADRFDELRQAVEKQGNAARISGAQNEGYLGALDAFKSSVETLQIQIGSELLPAFTKALRAASEWISGIQESGGATREFRTAMHDTGEVIKVVGEVLKTAHAVVGPFVEQLGGVARTLEILFGIALARKVARGFAGIIGSSAAASRKGIADATAFGRAWDIATRPRNMVVTTTTTGVPGGGVPPTTGTPPTRTPPTRTPPGRRPLPGTRGTRFGGAVGFGAAIAAGVILGEATAPPSLREQQLKVADMSRVDPKRAFQLAKDLSREFGTPLSQLTFNNPLLKKYGKPIGPSLRTSPALVTRPDEGSRATPDASTKTPPKDKPATKPRATKRPATSFTFAFVQKELARLEEAALDARAAPGTRDELLVYKKDLALVERALNELTLTRDQRVALKNRKLQLVDDIESIKDAEAAEAADIRAKRAAKRKEEAELRRKRERDEQRRDADRLEREYRDELIDAGASIRNPNLVRGERGGRRVAELAKRARTGSAADPMAARDELRQELGAIFRDFMQWQVNLLKQGSNVAGGNLTTHVLEALTREQTSVLREGLARPRGMRRDLDESVMAW